MSKHHVDQDYLAKRQLKKGTAGWFLLAGLGQQARTNLPYLSLAAF